MIFTVLAFLIALIAVFQGALFAGSGRLKASRRAIGDFSKYTSHFHYSFQEARFWTTTKVPFFRFPAITPVDNANSRDREWWKNAENYCGQPVKSRHSSITDFIRKHSKVPPSILIGTTPDPPAATHQRDAEKGPDTETLDKPKSPSGSRSRYPTVYAASWASLLGSFDRSLSLFEFPRLDEGGDSLLACDTEYLPEDISAAPATGNVETIVTMAALAGCDMISFPKDNEYPVAHGSSLQLTFREHPQLGAIATFQRFPGPETFYQ